jgi:hypothetical protein
MVDRPRSRTTMLVGWLTVAAMVVIAVVSLLISSPWNDKVPGELHRGRLHHSSGQP